MLFTAVFLQCKAATRAAPGKGGLHNLTGPVTKFSTATGPFTASACLGSQAPANNTTASKPKQICSNCSSKTSASDTWRFGPAGPQSLCNRCGLRYRRGGASALNPGSSAANAAAAAAAELAAVPVVQLPGAQPLLERISSAGSSHVAEPSTAQNSATGATIAMPVTGDEPSSSNGSVGRAVQPQATKQPTGRPAAQSSEGSTTRKSLRQKRPRLMFDEIDFSRPVKSTRTKKSPVDALTAVVPAASTGSNTLEAQRPKRPRDATGEAPCAHPAKITRVALLSSSSAASTSGGVWQTGAAGAVELEELELSMTDVRADAVEVLSTVAPRASSLGVRKSIRVAKRKVRQPEAQKASQAAAAEDDEAAAEILLGMARSCWVDGLVAALGEELEDC